MKKQFYTLLLVLIVSIVQAQNKLPFQLEKQWETAGFSNPESVVLDTENNVLYVSNVNGTPKDKDGNGYISKVSLEGEILEKKWASEGLNAPKGLAIYKGKLYAADIDKIVEIDIKSRRVSTHEIPDATFLNDVSIDKKGNVYVSNTFGFSAIYRLPARGNRKIEKWIEGDQLYMPNGMYATSKHLYVAAWGNGLNSNTYETKEQGFLYRIDLKSRNVEIISKPIGNLDGLSQTLHGFLLTDWLKGELLYYSTQQGTVTSVLDLPKGSADTYFDKNSKTIYIPLMMDNKIMSYQLKKMIYR